MNHWPPGSWGQSDLAWFYPEQPSWHGDLVALMEALLEHSLHHYSKNWHKQNQKINNIQKGRKNKNYIWVTTKPLIKMWNEPFIRGQLCFTGFLSIFCSGSFFLAWKTTDWKLNATIIKAKKKKKNPFYQIKLYLFLHV